MSTGNALTFGAGVDESDGVLICGEDVVDLGSECPSGELNDLPEVAADLVSSSVVATDL